jgi:hypothetical protein
MMNIDAVLSNQAIIAMILQKIELIENKCRTYYSFLQEEEAKRESLIENCSRLIDWANEQTQKIKDLVFVKQARPFMDTGVDMPRANIEEVCHKLEEDVDCIVNSRIPAWLSSVCYVFSHQWRKVVYEEIIKNYVFIVKYAEKEKMRASTAFDNNIDSQKAVTRNEIIAQINSLFKDIRQQVVADNKQILKIN